MNFKYPKTEVLAVLGSKVYPLYITAALDDTVKKLQEARREDFLIFTAAIRKDHGKGLWYPNCGSEPYWTDWVLKKSAIKSVLALPKPNIKIDYSDKDKDTYDF